MCQKCTPFYLAEAPQEMQDAIAHLNTLSRAIDEASRLCIKIEDGYREAGVVYHCTQLSARWPANFPQSKLDKLKETFDISSLAGYDAIFNPLHNIFSSIVELRATYLRFGGTPEQMCERAKKLEDTFKVLSVQLNGIRTAMELRIDDADALFELSRAMYETDDWGVRCAWHDPAGDDPVLNPVPFRLGEEWRLFRAWVVSLPETATAILAGRTLDEVALGMLYAEDEGFEDGDDSPKRRGVSWLSF
ncbi:hypothetical protein EK21DRAFT_88495 [Setomelanomma holmii]|uniref:Uncharacterized protein n=1 Tax=Setomelanomma holmii TaxID=210430 RepID=A0A9P4HBE1_9PLEO|nr:hypothetical protein EK21DRAFT_88495 [Setomelanomma holmii]